MAHELLIENGRAAMFYVDAEPWHGLGTKLEAPPTSAEAIEAALLDWRVAKAPLYVVGGTRLHEVENRFALVRADKLGEADCRVFGIAGRDYVPLQNADAFEFFDPIVQSGGAVYETAGALGRGERVWVLARLNGELKIAEGDPTRRYLLLSNSHDGTSSVQMKLTAVRVVCNNTLTLALREGGTIRVRHDRDLWSGLDKAKVLLGVIESTFDRLEHSLLAMAGARVVDNAVNQYLASVFPYPQDAADKLAAKRIDRQRKCAFYLSKHGKGNENPRVQGTVWAAYNGVTELIDHGKMAAGGKDHSSRRLHSVWFGQGAAVKARALRLATEWVETISPS